MKSTYPNTLGSERTVEVTFLLESLSSYNKEGMIWLDVGGIPSDSEQMKPIYDFIKEENIDYRVSDFRGGQYPGDFVNYDFGSEKFDSIVFLSSLEHFPQCTEGPDLTYKDGEDRRGFLKALSILKEKGLIFLTVPFGKHQWGHSDGGHHQNYNWNGILELTKGSHLLHHYTYKLEGSKEGNMFSGTWDLTEPRKMEEVLYQPGRAFGCGQFVLQKENE